MIDLFRCRRYFSGAFFLTAIISTAACGGNQTNINVNANQQPAQTQTIQTTAVRATTQVVPTFIQATGNLVAEEQSDIAPQASGQIVSVSADVGEFVGQGTVIAQLDSRDAQFRLQQARANENQAESAVTQAQVRLGLQPGQQFNPNAVPEVLAAQRTVEASQAQEQSLAAQQKNAEAQARLADDTLRRFTNLLETGDTSRLVYNQYRAQAEQAREQVNAVRSQINEARARTNQARQQLEAARNAARGNNQSIESAQATLANSRAATALAQKAVNDSIIRAPFAGYISERPVAIGEYVTPSSRIATLVRTNPIKVNLQLPEAEAGRIAVGQSVSLNVSAYPERQFAGTITAINPTLEAASRAIIVEGRVENSDNLLRPNMFATARILLPGGQPSVFVPVPAVLRDEATNTAIVYVIVDGKAEARAVQTGTQEGDLIQIITGVNEGELVATGNVGQLFDGATVSF